MVQQFNAHGERIGETFVWSPKKSLLRVQAGGQAWIGGMTVNRQGATVETGGYLRTNERVEIIGGVNPDGVGVYLSAASEIMAVNPAAAIFVDSTGNADIQGALLAGGIVERVYDATGQYLGRNYTTYNGDSTLRIEADNQIRVGLDLKAGKSIDLVGGKPVDPSKPGIVLYGSVQMSTWRPGSQINLNAPGPVSLLAPAHTQEIKADGFIVTADGVLSDDVTFDVWLDKVDFEVTASVKITKAATAGNTGIENLMGDLQAALDSAAWIVTQSDNTDHPVGSTYPTDPTDRDFTVKLHDSKLLLTSSYQFRLRRTSTNAGLLGFTALAAADLTSSLPYTLYAPQLGSTISIGAPAGPNGKLTIAGKVLADAGIALYSGTSADGVDVDLDATGRLETVHASITLNPGANGIVRGDVLARGAGSDVVINAANSLTLRGNIEAQRDIILNAGTTVAPNTSSVETYGTSSMKSLGGGGRILITGVNDVVINSQVGPGSASLSLVQLASTQGVLRVEKGSGNIETGALLKFSGHDVDIAGVVTSTLVTPAANDYEVTININGTAQLHGDFHLAGSFQVTAGAIQVYDTELELVAPSQRLTLAATGDVEFGRIAYANGLPGVPAGQRYMAGAFVRVPTTLEIQAGGTMTVNSGVKISTFQDAGHLHVTATTVNVVGSLLAGASWDSSHQTVWTGREAVLEIDATDVVVGGLGVDGSGAVVPRGGTLQATGLVAVDATGEIVVGQLSTLRADGTGGGALTFFAPGRLTLHATDMNLGGLVEALNNGAQLAPVATGLLVVDGLLRAQTRVTLTGGQNAQGVGVLLLPLVFDAKDQRVSGGVVTTALGGTVAVQATGDVVIAGVLGDLESQSDGTLIAQVRSLTAQSTAGAVTVPGRVEAADAITLSAPDVNVLDGGVVRTHNVDSEILLQGSDTIFVEAAGTEVAGLVQSPRLVHLLADKVRMYGAVVTTAAASRVLVNGVSEVTVLGSLRSAGTIEVNAGVSLAWLLTRLTSGTLTVAELSGSSLLQIAGPGELSAAGEVRLRSGGDVVTGGDSQLQDGKKLTPRPVILTKATVVGIATGYARVAAGTIQVPEVTWVTTRVTEQVGMEEVKIGSVFYTMDVTLEQNGYYNPRAAQDAKFREYFIEGIDYYNSNDYPHGRAAIPQINWSQYGVDVPSSNYKLPSYKTFSQLSDEQRSAVLKTLGYLPVYRFSYANPQKHQTIDGNPSTQTWVPSWAGNWPVVYYVDVAGWDDKYIEMPEGANEDVLRVVSQGLPAVGEEFVGAYTDGARVLYTQDKSAHEALEEPYYRESDVDESPARWAITYYAEGARGFNLKDGRGWNGVGSPVAMQRQPDWHWQSKGTLDDVYDNPTRRNVVSPIGYAGETVLVNNENLVNTRSVDVGISEDKMFKVQVTWTRAYISIDTEDGDEEEWAIVKAGTSRSTMEEKQRQWPGSGDEGWYEIKQLVHEYWWLFHDDQIDLSVNVREDDGDNDADGNWVISDEDDVILDNSESVPIPETEPKVYLYEGEVDGDKASIELRVESTSEWIPKDTLTEEFQDYSYMWYSKTHDISDKRLTLNYQWVSNASDIWGKVPRYETYDTQVKVPQNKNITLWDAVPVVENQSLLTGERATDPGAERPFGGFDQISISAGTTVTIDARQNVTLQAIAQALGGKFTAHAGNDLAVDGLVPAGAAAGTLPAPAELHAVDQISLTADRDLIIGAWAVLQATGTTSQVLLTGNRAASVSAEVEATQQILVRAGTDATVDGRLTASDLIDVAAGLATPALRGAVLGGPYADLQATGTGGFVRLTAGAGGGDIALDKSLLTAVERVALISAAGKTAAPAGLFTAPVVYGRAATGFSGCVAGNAVDVELSGTGNITLTSAAGVTLTNLVTTDGGITVDAVGAINAVNVAAPGAAAGNDITLRSYEVNGTPADLTLGDLTVGSQGDITLIVQGHVLGLTGTITADSLTIDSQNVTSVSTNVRRVSLKTRIVGDVTISQQGSRRLTVANTAVMDGSLTITHPLGDVILESVTLAGNNDANDLTVTAGGDIQVGWVCAGYYFTNPADVPAPEPGSDAVAGVTSLGDVILIAGGQVRESGDDPAVDLVADDLTISAQTGITELEVAVNRLLDLRTTQGSIELHDYDGQGETQPGLVVGKTWLLSEKEPMPAGFVPSAVRAPLGSVTITAENYLEVQKVVATGVGGTVRLRSVLGNLNILQPVTGTAIESRSGIALDAGLGLESYTFTFFPDSQVPDLIEYRAGEYYDFEPTTRPTKNPETGKWIPDPSVGIPSKITAKTVILECRSGLTINQPLTVNATRLELQSDTDVFIKAKIDGTLGTLAVTARGAQSITVPTYNEVTGKTTTVPRSTGDINIQTTGLGGSSWELRARQSVYLDLQNSFTVVGFIGGLTGYHPTSQVTVTTNNILSLYGGIIAADAAKLTAAQIDSNITSIVLAAQLELSARGSITLSTSSNTIVADSIGSGNITLNEADAVTLKHVQVANGAITVTAGGDLTAVEVVAVTDGNGNDVTLKSSGNIYVNYVDAGKQSGAQRAASEVTLDAYGTICEPTAYKDNGKAGDDVVAGIVPVDEEKKATTDGTTMVDVNAWKIHFLHGSDMLAPKLIASDSDRGSGLELEIIYTASSGGTTDGPTTMTGSSMPTHVDGDYLLMPSSVTGNLDITVTGTLLVLQVPIPDDLIININLSGGTLILVADLNVGSGSVSLTTTGELTAPGQVTAQSLTVTANSLNGPLTTDVDTLSFHVTGAGQNLQVIETDSVSVSSGQMHGGEALVQAGGLLTVTGTVSGATDLTLESTGSGVTVTKDGALSAYGTLALMADGLGADVTVFGTLSSVVASGATTSGPINLTAQNDVFLKATSRITSETGNVLVTADAQGGDGSVAILMSDGALVDAGTGTIGFAADGTIQLCGLTTDNNTSAAIRIVTTSGAIVDGGDSQGPDIQATGANAWVTLLAGAGVGTTGNALNTQIANLDLVNADSGDVNLQELDDLNIRQLRQNATTGTVRVEALGTLALVPGEPGMLTQCVSTQDGLLTLLAHQDLNVDSTVISADGAMNLVAYGDVSFSASSEILSTAGHVQVTADGDGTGNASGGAITMADGAVIDAGSGLVDLTASGNVTLASVVTTGEAAITSLYDRIVDGGNSAPELVVGRAALRARNGIGDADDPLGALETHTNSAQTTFTLSAVTQSGDIQVANTGSLTIGVVDGLSGVVLQGPSTHGSSDNIVITTASPQIINAPVENLVGGDILEAALGNLDTDDLTINARVTATGSAGSHGDIYLYAGSDILHHLGLISAFNTGNVSLLAGVDRTGGTPHAGNLAGDVVMDSSRVIQSDRGTVTITATRDIWLSILTTATNVVVSADDNTYGLADNLGEIIDNLLGEDAHLRATSAYLEAGSGIGQGVDSGTGLLGDIDTQLVTVQIVNHGPAGDIHVSETPAGGDLGVTWLTQSAPNGDGDTWVMTEDGTLTIVAIVAAQAGVIIAGRGDLTLFADGGDDSHLIINNSVSATTGTVNLQADEDVRAEDAGGTVTTDSGPIFITANHDHSVHTTDKISDGTIQFIAKADITSASGNITFDLPDYDGAINSNICNTIGTVTKLGGGILNINGHANTYTGPTEIQEGFFLVNGDIVDGPNSAGGASLYVPSLYVHSGALLGGSGTIGATSGGRDVQVNAGGILEPGLIDSDGVRYPGRLTLNGDLLMLTNAIFRVQLQGLTPATQYDQLALNGEANVSGDLTTGANGAWLMPELTFPLPLGATFHLIDNDLTERMLTRFSVRPEGDFFNLGNLGSYQIAISYLSRSGDAGSGNDPFLSGTGNDVTLTHHGRYDFNAYPPQATANYESVNSDPLTGYARLKTSANESGWDSLVRTEGRGGSEGMGLSQDPYTPLSLLRELDFTNTSATFQVDTLVQDLMEDVPLAYQVVVTSGDYGCEHDASEFTVSGDAFATDPPDQRGLAVTGLGEFAQLVFRGVTVDDLGGGIGLLQVKMRYAGNKTGWTAVINGLDIRPMASVGQIIIGLLDGSGPRAADGLTTDTYQGIHATPNALITVTTSNGTVTDVDDLDHYLQGVQVRTDSEGKFTFHVLRPTGTGDASGDGTGTGVYPDGQGVATITAWEIGGRSYGTATQTYTVAPARGFDFNTSNSPTATNYLGVLPAAAYTPQTGFGWAAPVGANDLGRGSDQVRRDFHFTGKTPATFSVEATPGHSYQRVITSGNYGWEH
ncbi:MAG: hypothetical protein NTY19_20895, partial [Planctomycetota bacterium]|nr:hypothetical protein [Planctomycetota bacterium]